MTKPSSRTERQRERPPIAGATPESPPDVPGQVVLVLQGGGALGAYHVGVYSALHEAGLEPSWVIGTSIGAINAAIVTGNPPGERGDRLAEFWRRIEHRGATSKVPDWWGVADAMATASMVSRGVPSFFEPNPAVWLGTRASVGIEAASYYSSKPLRTTLEELVDFDFLRTGQTRITVGAVNAASGAMRYFDSRNESLTVDHIAASGALPPAFGAVRIDGEPYWDGGVYSNTPIEVVLDDSPRRDSLIFAVNVWHQTAPEPTSIWEVMARIKDVQYASRADSHIRRQKQIHRLRHVVRQLVAHLPPTKQSDRAVRELAAWGCGTTMHIAHLLAPRLSRENHMKDIDFTAAGVRQRRDAGYADTARMIERKPWTAPADPIEGIVEHLG